MENRPSGIETSRRAQTEEARLQSKNRCLPVSAEGASQSQQKGRMVEIVIWMEPNNNKKHKKIRLKWMIKLL
jgi:hypothetical protein